MRIEKTQMASDDGLVELSSTELEQVAGGFDYHRFFDFHRGDDDRNHHPRHRHGHFDHDHRWHWDD